MLMRMMRLSHRNMWIPTKTNKQQQQQQQQQQQKKERKGLWLVIVNKVLVTLTQHM